MSSYIMKTVIGNEFDKIIKDFGISGNDNEEKEDVGMSSEELAAEQKREAAAEKARRERQARVTQEREEARQKIRDKYNLKSKDDPSNSTHSKTTKFNENKSRDVQQTSTIENQGSDSAKTKTNVFDSLKKKLGWK